MVPIVAVLWLNDIMAPCNGDTFSISVPLCVEFTGGLPPPPPQKKKKKEKKKKEKKGHCN